MDTNIVNNSDEQNNPVTVVMLMNKIRAALKGKDDFFSMSIRVAIATKSSPWTTILKTIQEQAEDNRPAVLRSLGFDLLQSIESIKTMSEHSRQHMERHGTIMQDGHFIHWSRRNKRK